jgi:hypothetical protein
MNELAKWVPRLITGTAIVHLAYGLVVPKMATSFGEIAGDGFVATVGGHPERGSWLWFMLTGGSWLGLGELARWTVRETDRLLASLGGWLLAIAAPLTVADPASGSWLVAAIGAIGLLAARAESPRRDPVDAPVRPALRT